MARQKRTDASGTGALRPIPVPDHYRQITIGSEIYCQAKSGISPNVELTLRHQYLLGNLEKKHRLEINLFIAPSSAEAHEYTHFTICRQFSAP